MTRNGYLTDNTVLKRAALFVGMAILCVWASFAIAGPLENFGRDWEQGKALPDWEIYQEVYANTSQRKITFPKQVTDPDAVIAFYEATMIRDGQEVTQRGLAAFYVKDGSVYYVEQIPLDGVDMAFAGQAADVATTAIGLSLGTLVEANPLGAAILPLKALALSGSLELPLLECIGLRQGLSAFGWGAAAWNVGVLLGAHPVIGVVAALLTGMNTGERAPALRECAIAKLQAPIHIAGHG